MYNNLEKKQVVFKIDSFPTVLTGRVVTTEESGIWIECKEISDQLQAEITACDLKKPVVFVPVSRFLWLISENPH